MGFMSNSLIYYELGANIKNNRQDSHIVHSSKDSEAKLLFTMWLCGAKIFNPVQTTLLPIRFCPPVL